MCINHDIHTLIIGWSQPCDGSWLTVSTWSTACSHCHIVPWPSHWLQVLHRRCAVLALLHTVLLSPGSASSSRWHAQASLVPPSLLCHGKGQLYPPAHSGVQLRLATGVAGVMEAEVMLTSIRYKLGGNSHTASPQILQCRSPQPCSAAVINSVTPPALSCCRSSLSPMSPLSSLPIAG